MITTKTPEEIKILEEGGKILASVLKSISAKVAPGVSTKELDNVAFNLIKNAGGEPAFLNYRPWGHKEGYPASLCVSINNEVVHGIPSTDRILKEGDIVSLDLGLEYKKLFTDMAVTLGVGRISDKAQKMIDVCKKSLDLGIVELKEGARLGDYGFAVEQYVTKNGFDVVETLVGHGVGYAVHEDPEIPNWGKKGTGMELKVGMVLALEPMVLDGTREVVKGEDDWVWKTANGQLSTHFEHTVVIEKDGAVVLTKY